MTAISPIPRPLRGSRIDSFYPIRAENLPSLSSLDSAFQLQEYISLVIRLDVHDVDRIVSIPGRNGKGEDAESKVTVDESCWIYEQLRRLAQDLTHPLITNLQHECNRQTCPEMKAGEWLYLCVAHGNDGGMEQCCAIDYILHTIDSATALLNSPRAFPSRLSIPAPSYRHFSSLARRLGRIFAHAYFHHRALFEQAEAESSLYRRFEDIVGRWNLVPREFLVIPTREDVDVGRGEPKLAAAAVEMTILTNKDRPPPAVKVDSPATENMLESPSSGSSSGSNSPGRRFGRNRTDTMVLSEASVVAEELSKSPSVQAEPEPESAGSGGEREEADPLVLSSTEQADTAEKKSVDTPAPTTAATGSPSIEESAEMPIVSPSSSTAPADPTPQDVRVVSLEDPPKKKEEETAAVADEDASTTAPTDESTEASTDANKPAEPEPAATPDSKSEPESDPHSTTAEAATPSTGALETKEHSTEGTEDVDSTAAGDSDSVAEPAEASTAATEGAQDKEGEGVKEEETSSTTATKEPQD